MTRAEFLDGLRRELAPLSVEDMEAAVIYYEELLDESENEAETLAHLGDPKQHATRILQEAGMLEQNGTAGPKVVEVVKKAPFYKSAWFWVAMALSLPISLPIALGLLAAGLGLVCAIGAACLAVLVAFISVILVLLFGGIVMIVFSFTMVGGFPAGFFILMGTGISLLGLGLLTVLGLNGIIKAIRNGSRRRKERKAAQTPQPEGGMPND